MTEEKPLSERITEAGNEVSSMWDSRLGREIQECGFLIKALEAENQKLRSTLIEAKNYLNEKIYKLEAEVKRLQEQNQRIVDENADWMTNSQKEYNKRMKAESRLREAQKLPEKWRKDAERWGITPRIAIKGCADELEKALK